MKKRTGTRPALIVFSAAVILITTWVVMLILKNHAPEEPAPNAVPTVSATDTPSVRPSPSQTPLPTATLVASPTPVPTVYPTARRGDKGEKVALVQQKLISLGYLSGRADGDFGARTEQALKDYQAVQGLTEDGIAGPKTMIYLFDGGSLPQMRVYRNAGEKVYHTRASCALLTEGLEEISLSDAVRAGLEECIHCH